MAILIDEKTKVIVQGMTGRIGQFHAMEMIETGTNVVGGVTPGRVGETVLNRPIFNTCREAVAATGAEATLVFVPPPFAADAMFPLYALVTCLRCGTQQQMHYRE